MYVNTRGSRTTWYNKDCKAWAREMHNKGTVTFDVPFKLSKQKYQVQFTCVREREADAFCYVSKVNYKKNTKDP